MTKKRYVLYLQAIPDNATEAPALAPVFFCRSQEAIQDVIGWLDEYSKEATPTDTNPRRARGIAVVGSDPDVLGAISEGRRPAADAGDTFVSIKAAAQALGVSRAYLHRMLGEAREKPSEEFTYPVAKIRGLSIAFIDDIPE